MIYLALIVIALVSFGAGWYVGIRQMGSIAAKAMANLAKQASPEDPRGLVRRELDRLRKGEDR